MKTAKMIDFGPVLFSYCKAPAARKKQKISLVLFTFFI